MEPGAFYAAAERAFAEAAARVGHDETWLGIAGRRVRLCLAGTSLHPIVDPVFAHLRIGRGDAADLTLRAWDCEEAGVLPPPQPWAAEQVGMMGRVGGFGAGRYDIGVESGGRQIWMLDCARGDGLIWLRGAADLPPWDRYCPLRVLLSVWAGARGLQLMHGGTVGFDGAGALVVGRSGSGKSTTVLACIDAGAQSAGDDYALVGDTPPTGFSLYGSMRLYESHVRRFPFLMPGSDWQAPAGPEGAPKLTANVSLRRPECMVASLPIMAIIVPRVIGTGNTCARRTHRGEALFALAPNTLAQVDPQGRAAFERIVRLCEALPCWRLELGSDIGAIAGEVRRAIAMSAAPAPVR